MKSLPVNLTSRTVKSARLCLITRRDGPVLRIAEAQRTISTGEAADTDWTPVAGCEISAVRHLLGGGVPSMEITATHSDGGIFDTGDIDKGMYDAATVSLYIVDRSNPVTLGLMFSGTVEPVEYDISGRLSLDVRGPALGARAGYIQKFAPMCRTDLFSPLCGLDPATYAQTGTVNAIVNKFNFTVSGLGAPPADGWFDGGVILTAGGVAFEAAHWDQSSLQITAFLPCNRVITPGEGLTLYPGCDKRIATCLSKFSNTLNFQGEPHSPGIALLISGGG